MEERLLANAEPGAGEVRVQIAQEQHRLEEDHARVPHGRRAAEQGQDHLADHRLHQKQKRGTDKKRDRKNEQHEPVETAHGHPFKSVSRHEACQTIIVNPRRRKRKTQLRPLLIGSRLSYTSIQSFFRHLRSVAMAQRLVLAFLVTAPLVAYARAEPPRKEDAARKAEPVKKPKPDVKQVVQALVKAYEDNKSKDLAPLCSKEFLKHLPPAQFESFFRSFKVKYGNLNGEATAVKDSRLVYVVPAEKQAFFLKITLDGDGLLAGLQLVPAMLENLPAGPLTLADVQERLRQAIEQTMYAQHVPSISLALVKGDKMVWTKAFGYMNLARSVPADEDTVYMTGSMFKVVVASAVMQLVDEGKLDLDKPVNSYLKGFQIPNAFDKEAPLTMRHLLSHHGGIPNRAQIVNLWSRELPITMHELIHKQMKVSTKPGTKFEYSNLAYTFNAFLVGQLSEMKFARAMQKRIFEPLQMTRTVFDPTPEINENLAIPYTNSSTGKDVLAVPRVRLDVWPAGDVYSTPADMARFLIMHLNEGKYAGKQVLSAKSVAEMATPQFAGKGAKDGQGLGWMINISFKRRVLWHNGAIPGFYAQMAIDPRKKLGVLLFCNKFDTLATALGVAPDVLVDLRDLALELLDRWDTVKTEARR